MLILSCALFQWCLPLLAISAPLLPAVACIVQPVKSVDGLRRVGAVLCPMASLSALQADVFVSLPLACALTLLATFLLGVLALAVVHVLPAVLREVTKCSARVALLVTVLLQRVYLHRCCVRIIDSTTHLVNSRCCCPCTRDIHKLSSKEGPRLESL